MVSCQTVEEIPIIEEEEVECFTIDVQPLPPYIPITISRLDNGDRILSETDAIILAGWIQSVQTYYKTYLLLNLLPTIENVSEGTILFKTEAP